MLPRTNKYFYKVPRQPGKIFTVDLKNSPKNEGEAPRFSHEEESCSDFSRRGMIAT